MNSGETNYTLQVPDFLPEDVIPAQRLVKPTRYELPPLSELWNGAMFNQALVPLKGTDLAADKASSDRNRLQFGRHFAPTRSEDALCSLQ